ncbi:MAG: hypothetical protein WCL70_00830 [Paludibacter sp.]
MKRTINYILILFSTVLVLSSCKDEVRAVLDTTADVNIHSFSINGVAGVIDSAKSTISVILPAGSSLKGLQPQITLADGAQVTPNTGDAVDFVDAKGNLTEITYIVTNKDLYQKYTVSVDVARAKISSFKIGSVDGEIDDVNKKITIYLPIGTDVTTLYPIVSYTVGATLSPAPGTAVDFSNPVTLTLTYLGSTFTYDVTVILGTKPKPVVVIYDGETVSPTWDPLASTVTNGTANPKTDGINTSAYCVSIMRNKSSDNGGQPWSGGALWNAYKVNIDPASYGKFTMMVLKNVAGDVQLEIQSTDGVKDYIKVTYSATALGQWQELTFTIPASRTAIINNILVAPHVVDTSGDASYTPQPMYWDNLKACPK